MDLNPSKNIYNTKSQWILYNLNFSSNSIKIANIRAIYFIIKIHLLLKTPLQINHTQHWIWDQLRSLSPARDTIAHGNTHVTIQRFTPVASSEGDFGVGTRVHPEEWYFNNCLIISPAVWYQRTERLLLCRGGNFLCVAPSGYINTQPHDIAFLSSEIVPTSILVNIPTGQIKCHGVGGHGSLGISLSLGSYWW